MKYLPELVKRSLTLSPSMRREWIEMIPPRSETGTLQMSPSMRREWIEIPFRKFQQRIFVSPSMRREWIEIPNADRLPHSRFVSLHAEGVD